MKRAEALIAALLALTMVVAGATWQFGPYGLMGGGAVLLVALLVFDVKGE